MIWVDILALSIVDDQPGITSRNLSRVIQDILRGIDPIYGSANGSNWQLSASISRLKREELLQKPGSSGYYISDKGLDLLGQVHHDETRWPVRFNLTKDGKIENAVYLGRQK